MQFRATLRTLGRNLARSRAPSSAFGGRAAQRRLGLHPSGPHRTTDAPHPEGVGGVRCPGAAQPPVSFSRSAASASSEASVPSCAGAGGRGPEASVDEELLEPAVVDPEL